LRKSALASIIVAVRENPIDRAGASRVDASRRLVRSSTKQFGRREIFPSYRRLLLARFPFGLIYRFDGQDIVIVAVAHNKRRSGYWRKRDEDE
jgi:hypothetical protein